MSKQTPRATESRELELAPTQRRLRAQATGSALPAGGLECVRDLWEQQSLCERGVSGGLTLGRAV